MPGRPRPPRCGGRRSAGAWWRRPSVGVGTSGPGGDVRPSSTNVVTSPTTTTSAAATPPISQPRPPRRGTGRAGGGGHGGAASARVGGGRSAGAAAHGGGSAEPCAGVHGGCAWPVGGRSAAGVRYGSDPCVAAGRSGAGAQGASASGSGAAGGHAAAGGHGGQVGGRAGLRRGGRRRAARTSGRGDHGRRRLGCRSRCGLREVGGAGALDHRPGHRPAGRALDRLQQRRRVGRRGGPVAGLLGHQPLDDLGELTGHPLRAQVGHGFAQDARDRHHDLLTGLARERRTPAEQREERGAEPVQVGRDGRFAVHEALGRAVRGGGAHPPVQCHGETGEAGDAEIAERGLGEAGHEDVGGLDVEVQDPGPVRGLERAREQHADVEDLRPRQRPAVCHPVGERAPGHEVHDDEGLAVRRGASAVDGDDVRMARQRAHGPALALEPAPGLVVADPGGEHLHGDATPERGFVGGVHDPEAAPPDRLGSFETRDDREGSGVHGRSLGGFGAPLGVRSRAAGRRSCGSAAARPAGPLWTSRRRPGPARSGCAAA